MLAVINLYYYFKKSFANICFEFFGRPKGSTETSLEYQYKSRYCHSACLIFKDAPFGPISGNTTMCAVEAELNY